MKGYLNYFKINLITGLQYKSAAIAGIITQFFWGFLQIFIYEAFYKSTGQNVPMQFENLVTYVWLQQALFSLIFVRYHDSDITKNIKDGTVAYELLRPYNMHTWWFVKCISKKLSMVALRAGPIIIVASMLPKPYNLQLPASFGSFIMFLVAIILGGLILTGIIVIVEGITFYTYDDKGVSNIIFNFAELLSGFTLPIPLLPNILQKISYLLPFRLIGDLSFRIYSGDIPLVQCMPDIIMQIVWLFILILFGNILFKKVSKKLYIQGG